MLDLPFDHTHLWYILEVSVSNCSEGKALKIIIWQTQQWSKDQPFAVLPLHLMELWNVKFDLIGNSIWIKNRQTYFNIVINSDIKQAFVFGGTMFAHHQQCLYSIAQRLDEVLAKETKLDIQIMLGAVIGPVDLVWPQKWSLIRNYVA